MLEIVPSVLLTGTTLIVLVLTLGSSTVERWGTPIVARFKSGSRDKLNQGRTVGLVDLGSHVSSTLVV